MIIIIIMMIIITDNNNDNNNNNYNYTNYNNIKERMFYKLCVDT